MNKKHRVYKDIMSGVSQMIPFVVAGGILIALAFMFDAGNAGNPNYGIGTPVAKWIHDTGVLAFSFMLPILSGFIAYSIADRPGFVPGFIGGALAINQSGFLGALLAGFIAGYLIVILKAVFSKLPRSMNGIKSVLLFPLLGTIFIALSMLGINIIVTPITNALQSFLNGMEGTSAILIGFIAGGMMAVDMGGPVNKAAYVVGVASVAGGVSSVLMAAVMAGGMTPPLGIALATLLFKKKFSLEQIEAGKANWILGASFITEGAIPFAAANPKKVMPSIIIGSAIAGAIIGIFQTAVPAPHGGLFVIFIMDRWWGFLVALLLGSIVTAILLNFLLPVAIREEHQEKTIEESNDPV